MRNIKFNLIWFNVEIHNDFIKEGKTRILIYVSNSIIIKLPTLSRYRIVDR